MVSRKLLLGLGTSSASARKSALMENRGLFVLGRWPAYKTEMKTNPKGHLGGGITAYTVGVVDREGMA